MFAMHCLYACWALIASALQSEGVDRSGLTSILTIEFNVLHCGERITIMAMTTITSKGQITLPAEFRKREGFHPGDKVVVREVHGALLVEPATSAVDRSAGMLAHLAAGRPPVTIEEMEEAAAAGWAGEPIKPRD